MGLHVLLALNILITFNFAYGISLSTPICEGLFVHSPSSQNRSYDNSKFELLNAINEVTRVSNHTSKLDAMEEAVQTACLSIGIPKELSQEVALRARKVTAENLKIPWKEASNGRHVSKKKLLMALEKLLQLTEVDTSFDIPYLAGYSKENPSRIYIDRGMTLVQQIDYANVHLIPFLVVHERIEKALIDTLPITKDRYLIPHQMAQRIEKEMVEAAGISWQKYQGVIMKREIQRAENPNRKYKRVPIDLDLTPYRELKDTETLDKMYAVFESATHSSSLEDKIVYPGVVHLTFNDQAQMAWTMMRFQEYYESPRFKGKTFSRKEFLAWFKKKKQGFTSYTEWDGFNFPSEILESFYRGKFNPLTTKEKDLLRILKKYRHAKFYIIATLKGEQGVYDHEIAHSLFYFNSQYKAEVLNLLSQYDLSAIKKYLREQVGDYHESVLIDEVHAWLAHDTTYLKETSWDPAPYAELSEKLQVIFKKYK